MGLRDKWLRFSRWIGEQTKPIKDSLPQEVTNWEQGELRAKADEFKAGEKWASMLGSVAGVYLGVTGGGQPTQEQVQDTSGEIEAGLKWLAVLAVVGLLIKKIFF